MRLLILFSDPELIFDKAQTGEEGFEGALDLFPQSFSIKQVQPELSGEIIMKDLLRFLLHCCARIPNLRLVPRARFSFAQRQEQGLWPQPKPEVRESRTSGSSAHSQKLETTANSGQWLQHYTITAAALSSSFWC